MAALIAHPRRCVNCFKELEKVELFCSQLCRDEAKWVRYVRKCTADGRIDDPDVREAIQIRRAHILSGGYDARGRRLSDDVRARVIERAGGLCEMCGRPGEEIDHIDGSSNDEGNLQLLCNRCHVEKTVATLVHITKESHPEAWEHAERLRRRAEASAPVQFCDSPEWEKDWRVVQSERRKQAKAGAAKKGKSR